MVRVHLLAPIGFEYPKISQRHVQRDRSNKNIFPLKNSRGFRDFTLHSQICSYTRDVKPKREGAVRLAEPERRRDLSIIKTSKCLCSSVGRAQA